MPRFINGFNFYVDANNGRLNIGGGNVSVIHDKYGTLNIDGNIEKEKRWDIVVTIYNTEDEAKYQISPHIKKIYA